MKTPTWPTAKSGRKRGGDAAIIAAAGRLRSTDFTLSKTKIALIRHAKRHEETQSVSTRESTRNRRRQRQFTGGYMKSGGCRNQDAQAEVTWTGGKL